MKYLLLFVIVIVALLVVFSQRTSILEVTNDGSVVLFGDSLIVGIGATEGNDLAAQLNQRLVTKTINLGVSGATSSDGLQRVNSISSDASIVIVSLGGNDILRKVSPEIARQNLDQLIAIIEDNGSIVVLLDVRPPILANDYKEVYYSVADTHPRTILVSNVMEGIFGNSNLLSDPIHPNDEGYRLMAERIYNVIKEETNYLDLN